MTNEERDLISPVHLPRGWCSPGTNPVRQLPAAGGSVPSSQRRPCRRSTQEADAVHRPAVPAGARRPATASRRLAVVTEAALAESQNRIKRLEWELEQTRNAAQQAMQQAGQQAGQQGTQQGAQQGTQQRSGGFFSNIFGGAAAPQQARSRVCRRAHGARAAWGGGYQPTIGAAAAAIRARLPARHVPAQRRLGLPGFRADHRRGRRWRHGRRQRADERLRAATIPAWRTESSFGGGLGGGMGGGAGAGGSPWRRLGG